MTPMKKNFATGRNAFLEALELLVDEVPAQSFSLDWLLDWHHYDEEELHEYVCREAGRKHYSE